MASERQLGFYWVRTKSGRNNEIIDDWTVGEWSECLGRYDWCVVGSDLFLSDSDMAEIGARITRDAK